VAPTDELRAHVRATMPELPSARRARLVAEWGIGDAEARTLVSVDGLADYAEAVKARVPESVSGRDVVNWATQDVLGVLNANSVALHLVDPAGLAELLELVAGGSISRNQAKDVLAEMLVDNKRPADIVAERGLAQVSDTGALDAVLDEVFATNADAVAEWRAGDDKVRKKKRGFLMGEAMKALKGQGNPKLLNELLDAKLQA
jgi:aspartyl-tRNA(Asn)/glutamyl-tRNA(Gln) amidotransferase subunit B